MKTNRCHGRPAQRWLFAVAPALGLALLALGCGRQGSVTVTVPARPAPAASGLHPIDLPKADVRPGAAVVLLIDTSGSMNQSVRDRAGKQRPKYEIAREALERIIEHTAAWKKAHPDRPLQLGIYHFSSSVAQVL